MNKLKTSVRFLEQHRKYSPHTRGKTNHQNTLKKKQGIMKKSICESEGHFVLPFSDALNLKTHRHHPLFKSPLTDSQPNTR